MKIDGTWDPAFDDVVEALRRQLSGTARGGASVSVYHRGRPVVDVWAGTAGLDGRPWERDTMALSFSTTKGIMATLVAVLVDRGTLSYDDPVERYWPEFGAGGKRGVLLRHLLCHEAGLHSIRSLIDRADLMLDWDHMVRVLARSEPAFPPGTATAYHGLTYGWLVGEVVRRATGLSLAEALETLISRPLALDGLYIGAPAAVRPRVADLLPPRFDPEPLLTSRLVGGITRLLRYPFDARSCAEALAPRGVIDFFYAPRIHDAPVPAANGVFTARSLARMYAAIAGGGELDGVRILSPAAAHAIGRIQNRRFDRVIGIPMFWRLGYHMVPTTRGILRRAFGHFGYGGSGAFADPRRNLAAAMTVNRVAGLPIGDLRMFQIGAAAAACADRVAAQEGAPMPAPATGASS